MAVNTLEKLADIALSDIGTSNMIASNQKASNILEVHREQLIDELQEEADWNFCRKVQALAQDADYTIVDEKYAYSYSLPSDYIRFPKDHNNPEFIIRENHVLCDDSELKLEYMARITDVSKWPTYFRRLMIARLRAIFAIPMAKSASKAIDWYGAYTTELAKAKATDGQVENKSNEDQGLHTEDNDTILAARQI